MEIPRLVVAIKILVGRGVLKYKEVKISYTRIVEEQNISFSDTTFHLLERNRVLRDKG